MAIVKIANPNGEMEDIKLSFSFDNGDFQALKNAIEQYNFKNEEALFRFALFILLQAENNNVFIEQNGLKKQVSPNPSSLKISNPQ